MSEERIIVGLDVGTTKICTVIAELMDDGMLNIIGEGTVPSDGLRRGAVVNLERTTASIKDSISMAENIAGVNVEKAFVGITGLHLETGTSHGIAAVRRGQAISKADVARTIENAKITPLEAHMDIIHVIPQEYIVDGQNGIKDPVGMSGLRLETDIYTIASAQGPLQNLRRCTRGAGLEVSNMVVQSLASGLAVLDESEKELAAILIDIGGSTTDVGVFLRGTLVDSLAIPLGGDNITRDISQLLGIPSDEAECIKKKHGLATFELVDKNIIIDVSHPNHTVPVSLFELVQVINPRAMEIFYLVKSKIEQRMGVLELLANSIVITGGASLMSGMETLATECFHLPVRLGKPLGISGLTDVVASPAHSTAVGLVCYGAENYDIRSDSQTNHEVQVSKGNLLKFARRAFKDFF